MNEVINVPDGWHKKKLGNYLKLFGGFAFKSEDRVSVGMRWLKIANVGINEIKWDEIDYLPYEFKAIYSNFILQENDIVMAMTRPLLSDKLKISKISKYDSNSFLNQRVGKFLFTNEVNKEFMYFLFQHTDFISKLMIKIIGTDPPNVGSDDIQGIILSFPKDKKEQEKIAKILSTLDTTIESTQKLIDKEKNIKKGLMSDLLQNGIDKNGKIRTPQTHKYKDSELGFIPEEWEIKIFSKIASINMGQSPESEFVNENQIGYPFLQGNAEFGDIHPMEEFWTPEPKKLSKIDDILISVRAPVGDINLSDKIYCIGRGLASITIKNIDLDFGYYSLINEKHQLNRLAQGSTFLAISKSDFDRLLIKVPKLKNEQKQIAKILNKQDEKIEKEEENLAKLKELKKGLMNDLLSGKVRVKL